MSHDDLPCWPPKPRSAQGTDGDTGASPDNDRLPGPGESWGDHDAPRPLHHVEDHEWGTAEPAPRNGPPRPGTPAGDDPWRPDPHINPRGAPPSDWAAPGPKGRGRRARRRAPQPQQGGYAPQQYPYQQHGHGGPMMRPNQHHMQGPDYNKLDTEDMLAIILSMVIPGVGHMMVGQVAKGIGILALTYMTCGIGYLLSMLVAFDVYRIAIARKHRPVGELEFFPKP